MELFKQLPSAWRNSIAVLIHFKVITWKHIDNKLPVGTTSILTSSCARQMNTSQATNMLCYNMSSGQRADSCALRLQTKGKLARTKANANTDSRTQQEKRQPQISQTPGTGKYDLWYRRNSTIYGIEQKAKRISK